MRRRNNLILRELRAFFFFIILPVVTVKGRKELSIDVCIGGNVSITCPEHHRIILASSSVTHNTCLETNGTCFDDHLSEILRSQCSTRESCFLSNTQLIGHGSVWCGENTVLKLFYDCQHESNFVKLCDSDKSSREEPVGNLNMVYIVAQAGDNRKTEEGERNETVAECTVNMWHQIISGFHVKVLEADFPRGVAAILCQESLFIGTVQELEEMQNSLSHLYCDNVQIALQAQTGISNFQVVQIGHIEWQNHQGLLIEITGEGMQVEHKVKYSNQTVSKFQSSIISSSDNTTKPVLASELDRFLDNYEKRKRKSNNSSTSNNELIASMALLATIVTVIFVVILVAVICWKRRRGSHIIREEGPDVEQRSAYVIGSLMDLRRYRLLSDGDLEENNPSPLTTVTMCSDQSSDLEAFRHELEFVNETPAGGFQPVLEAISEETLEDLDEALNIGPLQLDGSTIALYGSPQNDLIHSRRLASAVQSPLTTSRFDEPSTTQMISIEMKEMNIRGHNPDRVDVSETKLAEISSINPDDSNVAFVNRLGPLTKHKTLYDISSESNFTSELKDESSYREDKSGSFNSKPDKSEDAVQNCTFDFSSNSDRSCKPNAMAPNNNPSKEISSNETEYMVSKTNIDNISDNVDDNTGPSQVNEKNISATNYVSPFFLGNNSRNNPIVQRSPSPRSPSSAKDSETNNTGQVNSVSNTCEGQQRTDDHQYCKVNKSPSSWNAQTDDEERFQVDRSLDSLDLDYLEGKKSPLSSSFIQDKDQDDNENKTQESNDSLDKKNEDYAGDSERCNSPAAVTESAVGSKFDRDIFDNEQSPQLDINKKHSQVSNNVITQDMSEESPQEKSFTYDSGGNNDTQSGFRDPFKFYAIDDVQRCQYRALIDHTDTEQMKRDESDDYEKFHEYDFNNEIELKSQADIDLKEEDARDDADDDGTNTKEAIDLNVLDSVECANMSASNNSSFINISWSQADEKAKKKLEKQNCFTQ